MCFINMKILIVVVIVAEFGDLISCLQVDGQLKDGAGKSPVTESNNIDVQTSLVTTEHGRIVQNLTTTESNSNRTTTDDDSKDTTTERSLKTSREKATSNVVINEIKENLEKDNNSKSQINKTDFRTEPLPNIETREKDRVGSLMKDYVLKETVGQNNEKGTMDQKSETEETELTETLGKINTLKILTENITKEVVSSRLDTDDTDTFLTTDTPLNQILNKNSTEKKNETENEKISLEQNNDIFESGKNKTESFEEETNFNKTKKAQDGHRKIDSNEKPDQNSINRITVEEFTTEVRSEITNHSENINTRKLEEENRTPEIGTELRLDDTLTTIDVEKSSTTAKVDVKNRESSNISILNENIYSTKEDSADFTTTAEVEFVASDATTMDNEATDKVETTTEITTTEITTEITTFQPDITSINTTKQPEIIIIELVEDSNFISIKDKNFLHYPNLRKIPPEKDTPNNYTTPSAQKITRKTREPSTWMVFSTTPKSTTTRTTPPTTAKITTTKDPNGQASFSLNKLSKSNELKNKIITGKPRPAKPVYVYQNVPDETPPQDAAIQKLLKFIIECQAKGNKTQDTKCLAYGDNNGTVSSKLLFKNEYYKLTGDKNYNQSLDDTIAKLKTW